MNAPRQDLRARHTRLQDYQAMLARRLREARSLPAADSYLALQIGARHWLLPLAETGEVLDMRQPSRVPLTQPWYSGLVNARGSLLGVIDFSLFCGGAPTPVQPGSKLVVLSRQVERACAIVATRVAGLRHAPDLGLPHGEAAQGHDEVAAWEGQRFADRDGRDWQVLDVRALLEAPAFLQVGRSAA
ncbi:chemotaxis protein CheW [Cupriavidus oxalaticus]|jgi:twitching motility protein PilI|uniref:Chemotaxis protein CheW n=1 Tax=Cupriavidus oxalaticus TaxID=96344 RepID=A0A375GBR4_9BURK|nr:chemotaxis protein CheW [Cupriavidus oxalaticus]QEZ45852.1 chemotaxis protein CheW [Cupriavidus oxalaticus]QRQ86741.1 chemotaxis protein CheW [Cupriavidus oxalaticus]QRQ94931.1 chemotaxis protein CheW [Cupriavidus oxalaticus]WQD83585.1 chemotaxis protein CheW [Cupriavidus oxalaticus]SPC16840.1 Chemotaxis protein CheW [Cupriavidus oxalaticus]